MVRRDEVKPTVGGGAFDFASVGLAAGSGRLSMDVFAAYLEALRPQKPKPPKRKRERTR